MYICKKVISFPNATYREKVGVGREPKEETSDESKVSSEDDASGKDLIELPRVGYRRWLHPVFRYGHDGSIIEDGNDENHKGREVKLPN